jgi:cytosine/adenosine deaminase-related metal-dependent hydrolase
MTEATDSDLLKCAEAEVPIVVCARSNLYFGKRPPIKRMLDCGADVAVGTDNAMFSGPDMRSETSAFAKILSSQGGTADDTVDPMLTAGRKILYPHNKIHITVGMAADLAVLPCVGEFSFERMLHSSDPVFVYEPGRGSK